MIYGLGARHFDLTARICRNSLRLDMGRWETERLPGDQSKGFRRV
jgi:hypothetical protein